MNKKRYSKNQLNVGLLAILGWLALLLTACTVGGSEPLPTASATAVAIPGSEGQSATPRLPAAKYADLEIVTLLPRDGIPAIDNPQFLAVSEADTYYDDDELVMGVAFDGEARAYSVPFLSSHEIVNDEVSGVKIAVTW